VNTHSQFTDAAKADFASGADGWLVAKAMADNYVVVTREQFRPEIKRKVQIPNVCKPFGVTYVDTFEMLRQLGIRFS
jgi:hypothetical protein